MTITSQLKKLLGLHGAPRARLVTGARVSCPLRAVGDVDVDRCLGCSHLQRSITDADGEQWIVCSTPRGDRRPTQAQC